MSRPLLCCILVLLLPACATLPWNVESPVVTLADIRPLEFGLLEQTYLLKLRVQNPNAFDLPVDGLSFQLEINDQPFASGVSSRAVTIPRYGSEVVEVEAFGSLVSLFRQLSQFQKEGAGKIRYHLKGKLDTGNRLAPLSFNQRSELVLPLTRQERLKEEWQTP